MRGGGGVDVHVILFRKHQKSETKTCLKNLKEIDSERKIEPQYTKPYTGTTVLVYQFLYETAKLPTILCKLINSNKR